MFALQRFQLERNFNLFSCNNSYKFGLLILFLILMSLVSFQKENFKRQSLQSAHFFNDSKKSIILKTKKQANQIHCW